MTTEQLAKVLFGSSAEVCIQQKSALGSNDLSTLPLKTEVEIFRGGGGCAPLVPLTSYAPGDSSVGECPEDRVIGRTGKGRESWNGWAIASCHLVLGVFDVGQLWGKQSTECGQAGAAQQLV